MASDTDPYIEFEPGGLITAEGMNDMQGKIREDICTQVEEGVASITDVPHAADADTLGGESSQELCERFLEKALREIPSRTGYRKIFKELRLNETSVIKHDLKDCPLVDVYQLLNFEVVCDVDEQKALQRVNFYLYHTSEKKLRNPTPAPDRRTIEIESTDEHPSKIPFEEMLNRYNVPYTDASSLGDLETEFWKAFFTAPNDDFDPEQYCHSPWFERCCREERTVGSLKERGDFDDLWFKVCPLKTINYPFQAEDLDVQFPAAPTQIAVKHFDLDTMGIHLALRPPAFDPSVSDERPDHLKVMILLKV